MLLVAGLSLLLHAQTAELKLGDCTLSNTAGQQTITTGDCSVVDAAVLTRLAVLEAAMLTKFVSDVEPSVAAINASCPVGSHALALKDTSVAAMLPSLLRYKGALPGDVFLLNAFAGPEDGRGTVGASGQSALGFIDQGIWKAGPTAPGPSTDGFKSNANIPACDGHDPYAVRYDSPTQFTLVSVNGDTSGVLLCAGETEVKARLICSVGEDVVMLTPSPPPPPPTSPPPMPPPRLVSGVRPGIANLRSACPSGFQPFALKDAAAQQALPTFLSAAGATPGSIFLVNAFAGPTGGSAAHQHQLGYISSDAWRAALDTTVSTSAWTGNANIPACRWDQYAVRYDSADSFTLVSANGATSGVLHCETEYSGTRALLCTANPEYSSSM